MKAKIGSNFLYNSIYQILTMIIPLVTTPYVSRIIGSEGVGQYSYSYAIAYYFVVVAMLGVNNYGNRTIASVSDNIVERSRAFWSIYFLQLSFSLLAVLSYSAYVLFIAKDKTIGWIMLIYVSSAAFDINWFYFGMEQFKVTVARNSIVKLLTVFSIFVFVKSPNDVYIYAFVSVIGMLLAQFILWAMLKRNIIIVKVTFKEIITHLKPNLVLFIPVVAVSLYKFMDKIMLGNMTNNHEVGYYESCEKIVQIPIALITALGIVMLPRISNMLSNNQEERTIEYLNKSLILTTAISAPLTFGIMGVSKEFVPLFYGEGFEKCIYLFQIILPSCLFLSFANVIRTQYLIPRKKDNVYIISVISGAMVNLIVNYMLIPNLQSLGAAIGTLIAEATVCVIQCLAIKREINTIKYALYSSPFIVISAIMYALITAIDFEQYSLFNVILLKTIIGGALYSLFSIIVLYIMKKAKNCR